MSWYDDLTDEQREAASYGDGHARLLAGPGTGKTLVMTRHVAYLVNEKKALPGRISALTFTRHAAGELKQRVIGLVDVSPPPKVATLHSFALRQLLRNSAVISGELPQPLRIADDFDERYIIIEDLKTMVKRNVDATKRALNLLSADWETLNAETADWEPNYPDSVFLGAWQEHRAIYGYTLRAELVYRVKRALAQYPDFAIEGPPAYLLVDEYQDLNRCDLAVIRAIAERGAELFIAGDDDQSIYGFRHAHPEGIRRFEEDYPEAVTKPLTLCKRCDPAILQLGVFVASQDYQREPKILRPEEGRGEGEVQILRFSDQKQEAASVAILCERLMATCGYEPHDILILMRQDRNGAYSSVLRTALERAGVPVSVQEELDPFGVRPGGEVRPGRILLSLMRIAGQPSDHLAWRTLLMLRQNGLGAKAISAIYGRARDGGVTFMEVLRQVAERPSGIPRFGSRIASEYETIQQEASELSRQIEMAWDPFDPAAIVSCVREAAAAVIHDENELNLALTHIEEAALVSEPVDLAGLLNALSVSPADMEQHIEQGKVNVLTMHKAKGLTAKAVFVVAAEDELNPGRADTADEIGDERRLLYVSLTRAKHHLFMTYCQRRTEGQLYSGRRTGTPERTLTRFLRDGPLAPVPGRAYARNF